MKKTRIWALAALTLLPLAAVAQKEVEATVKADVVSQYIWRGQDLSKFSIQPSASIAWRGLSFTAEGSTGLQEDSYREIDLTLGYELGPINIGVSDYWCTGIDSEDRYLYYDQYKGAHKFEANLGFTCKYFSLQGYCMFWGNDYKIQRSTLASLERAYSTYIELAVPFKINDLEFEAKVGGTPMESGGWWDTRTRETEVGERDVNTRVYEYAEGAACTVASLRCTKKLDLGDLKLPIYAEFNANPYLAKAAFLFGVTIEPW